MDIRIISFAALTNFALAFFLTFSSAIVHADSLKDPKDKTRPEYDMKKSNQSDTMNLTGDQKIRIEAIRESYRSQLATINSSILALDKQHKMLDTSSPTYAVQVKMIDNEKARLMHMKKGIKDKIM